MIKLLLLEDDQEFAFKCVDLLVRNKYGVKLCATAEEAKSYLLENDADIALIDLMLPPTYGEEGLEFLRYLRGRYRPIEPIMMTVKDSKTVEIVATAMNLGARDFIDKNKDWDLFEQSLLFKLREVRKEMQGNIFVSHGHSELLKLKLKDFIRSRLQKNVIILSEQPNQGLTVVEKLERVSERCCFAIILMTKDDEQRSGGARARQNVIHEIGFFQGKYGRSRVILVAERGVELFTNISGIVRIEFEPNHFETVFEKLRVELEGLS